MKPFRNPSLATIVAVSLVTVTTLLVATYSALNYERFAVRSRNNVRLLTSIQARELAVALALPIWNIDRAQGDKVLEAMAQAQAIWGVYVEADGQSRGRARSAHWKLVPWDGRNPPRDALVASEKIFHEGQQIGMVHLYVTRQFNEEDLRNERLRMSAGIASIIALLILSIYLVLWRTAVQPIMDIERYAVAVSSGGELSAPAHAGQAAELVSLRTSIETMVRLLDRRYAELQEEAVRRFESEERFRAIFDSVNDAIFIHDRETGEILEVNARMREMWGFTRDEAVPTRVEPLCSGVPPFTEERAVDMIRGTRRGERRLFEWHTRHKDGHLFWVEISMRMATIGGASRVLVVARDITQRKEMEEALRRSETMSAMGSLVAGVAHEVRNPLFGIAATIDAFEAEFGGGEGAAEYMASLRHDISRLSRLMNDLLEYGRPQGLSRHVQSLEPVIAEAIRVAAPRAKEREVEIRPKIEGPLPHASIDSERIVQVLRNVVENAIEFSSSGQSVVINARGDVNGSSAVVLEVADHGPGFRADDLPHVFEPFFTRRHGGSGLGLAIVQKIVTDHGGTVQASNAADGGGMIEIRIPATERG